MSRAFVREQDNVPLESPPELEPGAGPHLVTQRGFDRITGKVAELDAQLRSTADEAIRNRLARDLRYWEARKSTAHVILPGQSDTIEFGSRVTIQRNGRRQVLELVGEDEADPAEGRVNWLAPLPRAILGARVGETVLWEERQPPEEIRILAIDHV